MAKLARQGDGVDREQVHWPAPQREADAASNDRGTPHPHSESAQALAATVRELSFEVQALSERLAEETARRVGYQKEVVLMLNSTTWRGRVHWRGVTRRLRTISKLAMRKAGAATRLALSGQLGERLRKHARRGAAASLSNRTLLIESDLFDPAYYREMYPDVAGSREVPVEHYLKWGGREGRDPSEAFSSSGYFARYPDVVATGLNPLVHYLRHGRQEGRQIVAGRPLAPTVHDLLSDRWPALRPLSLIETPAEGRRLTVVTDSVGASSLFGGVGTALILAALYCNRAGATLRVATRQEAPDAAAIGQVLKANGVNLRVPLQVALAPQSGVQSLPVTQDDVFLTTSWWTTRSVLGSVAPQRLVYLLQEDERMFYAQGDERLLCAELLDDPRVPLLVNSRLLFDHLAQGPNALKAFGERATAFEPAFPSVQGATPKPKAGKRDFFFYSRPHHQRNLFWRGATVLADAIEEGILPADEWAFHYVGRGTPAIKLPGGARLQRVEWLSWKDYRALIANMDAALVLMDTPHPSYPPLDLAGAGVAVLTNSHPGKTDLSHYSRNIILRAPAHQDLMDGLAALAKLGKNDALRKANLNSDGICRDWPVALDGAVDVLERRFGKLPRSHVR